MKTINFTTPQSWQELTDKQLRYVYTLIAEDFTTDQIKLLCLFKWSRTKVLVRKDENTYIIKQDNDMSEVTSLMLAELLPHIDWLGQLPTSPVRLSKINRQQALPADFQDVPFETYIIVDNLYQGYLQNQSDDLLDQLASVLYGRQMKLTEPERISIFYWIASLKDFLAKRYPDFLQPTNNADDGNLLGSSQPSIEEAMNAQIRALTKGDITKEKQILALDTWRALTELNAQAKEYKDLKQMNNGK